MKYSFSGVAKEQLKALSKKDAQRIADKIRFYTAQKDPFEFAKSLAGYKAYRFRVGDYRIIFDVAGDSIYILMIVKRDTVYRDL